MLHIARPRMITLYENSLWFVGRLVCRHTHTNAIVSVAMDDPLWKALAAAIVFIYFIMPWQPHSPTSTKCDYIPLFNYCCILIIFQLINLQRIIFKPFTSLLSLRYRIHHCYTCILRVYGIVHSFIPFHSFTGIGLYNVVEYLHVVYYGHERMANVLCTRGYNSSVCECSMLCQQWISSIICSKAVNINFLAFPCEDETVSATHWHN